MDELADREECRDAPLELTVSVDLRVSPFGSLEASEAIFLEVVPESHHLPALLEPTTLVDDVVTESASHILLPTSPLG
ncbi:MAG: hypothetical protein FJ291_12235 [Planctomycetes bacterium]|nr:hypothetical protein [Planctomycetota bacterium]